MRLFFRKGLSYLRLLISICLMLMAMPLMATSALQYGPGVNLPMWSAVGPQVNLNDYKMIREAGFKSVRQPVNGQAIFTGKCDVQHRFVVKLKKQADLAATQGLTYILDFHPKKTLKSKLRNDPDGSCIKLMWTALAKRLKDSNKNIIFELLNEPGRSSRQNWWSLQHSIANSINRIDPDRTIFCSASGADSPWGLVKEKPYGDLKNIVYVFHDYTPMKFTHQGANWNKSHPRNVRWGAERNVNEGHAFNRFPELQLIHRWSVRYNVRIVCDEFGVYRNGGVRKEDRMRYFQDITSSLNDKGIPWVLWQYYGGFGITRNIGTNKSWEPGVLDALNIHGAH